MRLQETVHVFGPPGIHQLVQTALGFPGIQLAMPVVLAEFSTRPGDKRAPQPAVNLANVMLARLRPDAAEAPQTPSPQVPMQHHVSGRLSFGCKVALFRNSAGSSTDYHEIGQSSGGCCTAGRIIHSHLKSPAAKQPSAIWMPSPRQPFLGALSVLPNPSPDFSVKEVYHADPTTP